MALTITISGNTGEGKTTLALYLIKVLTFAGFSVEFQPEFLDGSASRTENSLLEAVEVLKTRKILIKDKQLHRESTND